MNFNYNNNDDDLVELNTKNFNNKSSFNLKNPIQNKFINNSSIRGTDLLFNKSKISADLASMSSMSSHSSLMSSDISNNKKNNKKNNNDNDNNDDNDDDDDDDNDADDNDDDDDDDNNNNDDDDEEEDEEENNKSRNIKRSYGLREELNEKRELLYQLERLQSKGYKIPLNYNMDSSLEEIKNEYQRIVRDKEIDASIRFQRKMLMAFVTGTEYLNVRYNPVSLKLEGWSEQVHENITDYDDIFEELHEKYKSSGKKMPAELRLFISLTGSAFMYHLTARMFKESNVPNVEEVLKSNPELMKQFQNAAAKQYINENIGTSNRQNHVQQPSLFGMIGNLFGGLNNPSKFNDMPKQNNAPLNDINNIINNVHNKISTKPMDDNRIETLSISDEEITSIIEDAADVKILKTTSRGKKNRTLNI